MFVIKTPKLVLKISKLSLLCLKPQNLSTKFQTAILNLLKFFRNDLSLNLVKLKWNVIVYEIKSGHSLQNSLTLIQHLQVNTKA